jgi:uncharacterized membrane protein YcjF (UPF0283 family)
LPGFSVLALTLVAALASLAVGASVVVWRIRSLAAADRCGLIGAIAVIVAAGIGWIVFVSPVYVD